MARFNLVTNAQINLPPTQLGDRNISVTNRSTYVVKQSDFTDTVPVYVDPEGNLPKLIKITSLPVLSGTLRYNTVAVILNQEIEYLEVGNGNLVYESDQTTDLFYSETVGYDIADDGSEVYSGLQGNLIFNVQAYQNLPPDAVGDNSLVVAYNSVTVFTTANFTTETTPVYSDPEGDAAESIKILALPVQGTLSLSGIPVSINEIITFTDITAGNLSYVANGDTQGYSVYFDFSISDAGSNIFTT